MPSVSELRERWLTPEGARLAASVLQRATAGEGLESLGVDRVDGRWDLRGFSAARAQVRPSGVFDALLVEAVSGATHVKSATLRDLDLSAAWLDHWRFTAVTLENCVFDRASCRDWRLWACMVRQSSFVGTDLRDGALGTDSDGRFVSWTDVDFSRARLDGSFFYGGSITRCDFSGSKVAGVKFWDCDVADTVYTGNLKQVLFDLRGRRVSAPVARLQRVDFSRCTFDDVGFRGCQLDTVELPPDPNLVVVRDFLAVAPAHLERVAGREDAAARAFRAVIENEMRGETDAVWDLLIHLQDVSTGPEDPARELYRALASESQ